MKKYLTLAVSLLLSGCIAAVVAGAAAGSIVYDKRSLVMIERDARIFHLAHTAIVTNPKMKGTHVDVTSFNQAVLLVGEVRDASQKALAQQIAAKTPEVLNVYNQIKIAPPMSLTAQTDDAWITSQVRGRLLMHKGLASGSIRVVTENKVVYLMGIVTRQQAAMAADSARQVKGVVRVVKVFRYYR